MVPANSRQVPEKREAKLCSSWAPSPTSCGRGGQQLGFFLSFFLVHIKSRRKKKAELGFVIRILKFVLFSLLLPKQFIELCKSWEIQKSQKKMNISGKGGNF